MKYFLLIIFTFTLSISFGQNTPQNRAENVVIKHIQKTFKDKEYHGYEFGDLFKITPSEIVELEKLKETAKLIDKKNDSLVSYYDSLINYKTQQVKSQKLFSTYDINHFFTLKEKYGNPILYEYNFILYPDGKVKDVKKELEYKLTADEYNYYYYFYKKKDLYNDEKQNVEIYNYLENLYNKENTSKKSAMSTLLTVSKVIYEYDVYDTVLIARIEAQKWLTQNVNKSIEIKEYSDVNSIKDTTNNSVIGYNLFAKIKEDDSISAYYFEFDYDYILRGVLPVEAPFEQYFNNPNKDTIKNK